MSEHSQISIVIVGMNNRAFLPACLGTVAGLDYPEDKIEIIYADNASSDGSVEYVGENYPSVRIIRNRRNLGFAEGTNVGLRVARGEYLVLLNADAELDRGWMTHMLACFQADPYVGIAGCKIYFTHTKKLQHAGGYYDVYARPHHYGYSQEDRGQFDERREVGYVTGAALMISRRCLSEIGLLDPYYFAYGEEIDWAEAAKRAGFKIMYVPEAVAYHYEMCCIGGKTNRYYFLLSRNRYRFLIKYFGIKWFLATFLKDLRDGWTGHPDVPWRIQISLKAFLWNVLHLPRTVICRKSKFK